MDIGHRLYGQFRHEEHRLFFEWLHQQIIDREIDALIIAGDLFDTHNPSAESTKLYYNFLMNLHRSVPELKTIIIGGNHDSAQRLDAAREVLKALNVHVIGGLPALESDGWDDLYVHVKSQRSGEEVWIAAVPFLRASDLPLRSTGEEDRIVSGVREVYHRVIDRLMERLEDHQAFILTGHCEMTSGLLSLDSERRPRGYSDQSLPTDVFTSENIRTQAALGHLHLAQEISVALILDTWCSPLGVSLKRIIHTKSSSRIRGFESKGDYAADHTSGD